MAKKTRKTQLRQRKNGKTPRNKLEIIVWDLFKEKGVEFEYEARKLQYTLGGSYTPDFFLPNGVIIETKGYFRPEDKRKMRAVKIANPDADIRLVFSESQTPSGRKRMAQNLRWSLKWGFPAAEDVPPEDWYSE